MKENISNDKDYKSLNNPDNYALNVPYLLYDENGETIITRTAKGINKGDINPFETNMMEVTLYFANFVNQLLELIDTDLLKDVAQAIDDEECRHAREDGQITHVSSEYYGTGQGLRFLYSWDMDNWNDGGESVDAMEIAEIISDRRNKAETYRKKIEQRKKKLKEQETSNSYVLSGWSKESSSSQVYEEYAFNAQTKLPCFTNRQMGIFMRAIAELTEDPVPAKTTLGEVVEKIAGYKAKTVNQNMKGIYRNADKEIVAKAIECRLPKLAAKVRKL